jgi:diguanylate cyclase (GGDEF)-like protein/PAS domain S-box-containing protein
VSRLRSSIRAEEGCHGEMLNYRKDGTPYWVELTITPLHDAAGVLTGFVGMSRNITARRAADRERQTLAAALAVAADGVAIVDAMGSLEFVNQAFARQAGGRAEDLVGRVWLSTLYTPEEARYISEEGSAELTSLGFWHGEVRGKRVSGESFPQEVSLTLLPQGGMVAVVRDISERKAAEDRLKFLSTRDELTGLLNRRGFMHAADNVIREARAAGRTCALLYGDLDSFKLINDRFGHPVGDVALQEVAKLLTHTFRSTDLVARLGGDEFTVLACDVGREELDRVIARLDDAVAQHNAARSHDPASAWTLGVSLGVAFAEPDEPGDIDVLLRQADAAQYIRKSLRKSAARAA